MERQKLIILIVIIFLLLAGGGFVLFGWQEKRAVPVTPQDGLFPPAPAPAQVSGRFQVGQPAPDVTLTAFDGSQSQLADYRGRAVVLDFWAAWCPFCIAEMPELEKAQDRYGEGLVMIGVHRTDTESTDLGLEFAKNVGVSYLLVTDADGSLYRASGGFGMPVAVFIDGEGVVREIKSGPKTTEEIEEKIADLL